MTQESADIRSYGGGGVVVSEIQVSLCCDRESQLGLVSLIIYVLTSRQTLFLRSKLLVDEHSASEDLPYTVSTTRGYR